MQISFLKSQQISDGFSNLYINNWENGGKIGMDSLHLVFRHF